MPQPPIPPEAVEAAAVDMYEHTTLGMDACRLLARDAITTALPHLLPERTELELLRRQRTAVLDVLRANWHAARRWKDPNPVPGWIRDMLAALEVTGPACDCQPCAGSDTRWAVHHPNGDEDPRAGQPPCLCGCPAGAHDDDGACWTPDDPVDDGGICACIGYLLAPVADEHERAMTPMPGYSGWAIQDRDALLARLAAAGINPVHPTVVLEHITHAYPDTRPAPHVKKAVRLVGVAADHRVQVLVAEVDGTTIRRDGRRYHCTFALAEGAEPVESNDLLARPGVFAPIIPITVRVFPFLRTLDDYARPSSTST